MRPDRRGAEAAVEEAESYYVSMTDMLVGVLFIFIILLSFFALQFRKSTAALTQAKDAQTTTLLKLATKLERIDAALEVDREHHVVCLPGSVLGAGGAGPADRHCFAFSDSVLTQADKAAAATAKARATFTTFVQADLQREAPPVAAATADGALVFAADRLFLPGGATLSPDGEATLAKVAVTLGARLPCFGYGAPATGCTEGAKMSVVNVAGSTGFDASSAAGQAATALSLQRSVAVREALVRDQPVLGRIRNAPQGGQPLLQVSNFVQSQTGAPVGGAGQTISIQFNMAG